MNSAKNALLVRLLPGIVHEINNPVGFVASNLSTMRGYIEDINEQLRRCAELAVILESDRSLAAEEKELLDDCRAFRESIDLEFIQSDILALLDESNEGMRRIQTLTHSLREVVLPDDGSPGEGPGEGPGDEPEDADINECLETALNVIRNELKYKAVVDKQDGHLPLYPCYPRKMTQAFLFLLADAGRVMAASGKITIHTIAETDRLLILIRVSGGDSDAPSLTDPSGEPLLPMAEAIISTHGGTLDLTTAADGGRLYTVSLPL